MLLFWISGKIKLLAGSNSQSFDQKSDTLLTKLSCAVHRHYYTLHEDLFGTVPSPLISVTCDLFIFPAWVRRITTGNLPTLNWRSSRGTLRRPMCSWKTRHVIRSVHGTLTSPVDRKNKLVSGWRRIERQRHLRIERVEELVDGVMVKLHKTTAKAKTLFFFCFKWLQDPVQKCCHFFVAFRLVWVDHHWARQKVKLTSIIVSKLRMTPISTWLFWGAQYCIAFISVQVLRQSDIWTD